MTNTEPNPGPAYRIITPRLLIRCPEPADASALHTAIQQSLDHLSPWLNWANETASLQDRVDFLRTSRANFDLSIDFGYLIFNHDETVLIGGTGLHTRLGKEAREIGYWIHKDHINQGYGTEVAAALTRVAFEVDHVSRVEIHCSPKNTRSASIPRKLGFTHEATLHNRVSDVDGFLRDAMIWSLFQADYPNSPCARIELQAFDAIGRRLI
jgi:RimJ/RimL family protein N-acetyltransferase